MTLAWLFVAPAARPSRVAAVESHRRCRLRETARVPPSRPSTARVTNYCYCRRSCLQVIVRYGASSCTEHSSLQYSATASDFRAFFDDGSSPEHLIERRDDNLVVLKAAWLGITIRVRRTGIYLTVAIQLPSAVQDEVGGLCFTGCPSDELLEYKLPSLSAQVVLPHVARYACDHVEEDTFFFQSCVFDLVMTGDRNFTVAALEAKKDVEDLQAGLPVDSAAERVTRHGALVVVLALMSLLLTSKIDEFV